jgi:hypothetical protein
MSHRYLLGGLLLEGYPKDGEPEPSRVRIGYGEGKGTRSSPPIRYKAGEGYEVRTDRVPLAALGVNAIQTGTSAPEVSSEEQVGLCGLICKPRIINPSGAHTKITNIHAGRKRFMMPPFETLKTEPVY